MKKNTKKIATVTMTSAVLLAAPIAMNAAPMLSAQAVEAAVKTGWVKESGKWYFYKDGAKATGWQEWDGKRYYLNADGTMKANEWMIDADGSIYYFRSWGGAYKNCNAVINGRSYTFGADSKMQGSQWVVKGGNWYLAKDGKIATGWQEWQGSKYYLNSDGTMRSNEWRLDDTGKIRYLCSWGGAYKNRSAKINGRSYTFNSNADVTNTQWIAMDGTWKLAKDGRIATGWQTWENNLYYLNSDGSMKANEAFTDGGKLYFFRSWGGAYKNCWYTSNGKKYYLHDNSAAYQNEWLKADGKWYYFQSDSTMAANTWIDNYYVDASGVWIPNKEKPTDKWITSGNRKWYRHADGSYTKNDWEVINGKYYRFDNEGWMVTGWKKINDIWYYMDKTTGERYGKGWHWIDGNCYYMNANGEMAADTWIDGYYVDASGKWIKDPKNEEHTHKWVEETKTVNHPEESHIEIKHHDAVTHTVNHDEEFHYETVNHPEESHMETVHHEEVGHTVHHEAEGYYNTVHHDEISHEEIRIVCLRCGSIIDRTQEALDAHLLHHENLGESIQYAEKVVKVVDQEAYDEQVWVETKAAWDEYVIDQEAWDEQVKVVDKAAWSEQVKVVDKEAWTETIIDKEAYDEKIKVIDKAAYDETIKQKVCSICGKIQK
jgi:glucan-binding YG repeat protein